MPELGESVHEGTVTRWLKKVGDLVEEDEPIVEIMTDKVNQELQAPAAGTLVQILIPEGAEVKVFAAMGLIEPDPELAKAAMAGGGAPAPAAEAAPAPKAEAAPAPAAPAEPAAPLAPGERKFYTPLVRSMAKEHGISEGELAGIRGSGAGGRVSGKDLKAYIDSRGSKPAPAPASDKPGKEVPLPWKGGQEVTTLTGMRKMIAEAMVRSAAVPTVSTLIEIDVTAMVNFRSRNKDSFQEMNGVKLTYTPFFIKSLTETLAEFPMLNAALHADNQLVIHHEVHMGVAVSLGKDGSGGLIVPVIRDAHKKTVIELAKNLEEIAAKARASKLGVEDVQGGTFTLTNPGSYGAVLGTPMINAPQSGILGVYGIIPRVVSVDGLIGVRQIMNAVLTYDHRLVDGLTAGRFLQSFKQKLEAFDYFK